MPPSSEKAAVLRMLRGYEAAEERQRELRAAEGPNPAQAVAELNASLNALMKMGLWPGPRDPASERSVEEVRRRWARIQRRDRQARSR